MNSEVQWLKPGLATPRAETLGAADGDFSSHEFFVVEHIDRAFCLIDRPQGDEGEALGALALLVGDYFGALDTADAVEEFLEIFLCGVVGKVANVEAWAGDFDRFGCSSCALSSLAHLLLIFSRTVCVRQWVSKLPSFEV